MNALSVSNAIRKIKFMKWRLENYVQVRLHRTKLWRKILRKKLAKRVQEKNEPLRVILGGGAHFAQSGWCLTEQDILDVLNEGDWQKVFHDRQIDNLLAEHVWEHLSWEDGLKAARYAHKWLCPGGTFRVAVPDGLHPHPDYIADVRPGGCGAYAWDHKVLFTYQSIMEMFESAGFVVRPLEYWNEKGDFDHAPWSFEGGYIIRRPEFAPETPAFSKGPDYARTNECVQISPWDHACSYKPTSLIVDAHKPR